MDIQMIAIDLDNTILRGDKTISDYSIEIFNRCHKKGIKIVFATARPIRAVTIYQKQLPCDGAAFHNGAVIHIADNCIKNYGIEPVVAEKILSSALSKNKNAKLCIEMEDALYTNFDSSTLWPGVEYIFSKNFSDLPRSSADKINILMSTMEELQTMAVSLPDDLYIEMSENTLGMIMNKKATKLRAIREMAEYFQISLARVAAFGDDYTDIEMIRDCGCGVAVSNSINEVKAVADYICESNESDGVAKWIEENIL